MTAETTPLFACDVMLGSLARWLRAAGYDASWSAHIDDWDLIRLAQREGRTLLSSDTGIFRVGIIRDREVAALWVPHGLTTAEQLTFVLRELGLAPRRPRCMACGGELAVMLREDVRDRVPAGTFARVEQFHACGRCGQIFWQGSHWQRIAGVLEQVGERGDRPGNEEAHLSGHPPSG